MTHDPTRDGPRVALERKRTARWGAVLLASAVLLGVGINVAPATFLVSARSLMFSKFLADDATGEARLNGLLATRGVVAADPWQNRGFVDPQAYRELYRFAEEHQGDGTAVAREIISRMTPGRPTGGCGAEALSEKVAMVADRKGCCSDYAAAFQVYAGALGLPVRRVETMSHTTNEYFDSSRGSWVWVDTMYGTQAADDSGQLLSFYQLRERRLKDQPVHIVELTSKPIEPLEYHVLFDAKYYAIAYWYPPTDLTAVDEFDAQWRRLHITRPVRQFAGYLAGVRAEPTALASASMIHRLRLASLIAWISLTLLAITLLLLAITVAQHSIKLTRELLKERATAAVATNLGCPEESE